MGVVAMSHTAGLGRQNEEIIGLLKEILSEVKGNGKNLTIFRQESSKGLVIYQKGYMLWWKKLPDAAGYRITLFVGKGKVGKQEIDVIEIERNRAYHTFTDLVGTDMYTVRLEAEDRGGNIVDSVEITL